MATRKFEQREQRDPIMIGSLVDGTVEKNPNVKTVDRWVSHPAFIEPDIPGSFVKRQRMLDV